MHNRLAMTAAGVVSTGLFLATPWALAESSSLTGTPETAIAARAGAVTLGQFAYISPVECPPGANPKGPTTMAQYSEAGAPSYTTPFAGVITSYPCALGRGSGPSRRLRTLRHGWPPESRCLERSERGRRQHVGQHLQDAGPGGGRASIGLNNSAGAMICWGAGVAGDQVSRANVDPAASADFPGGNFESGKRVNISAVLEPDVDGDQYGDISQDLCPQSKLAQTAWPAPDTTVTKKPKRRSAARKVRIKFSSTVAGSTFTCAVVGRAEAVQLAVRRVKVGSTPWSSPPRAPPGSSTRPLRR